ncbi:hypothetical protein NQ318_004004 [Aromia moschata]|uniref:MADF domain-containing protein n=1 Tax=Aromia moschata TaxID=1265417 RepID=A0AAV8Z8S6_9CUCU|nr:hypothetical protein NQ318_004004 [Aromia moschata]
MNKDNGPIPTSPLFALINKDSYGSVNRGNRFGINSAKLRPRFIGLSGCTCTVRLGTHGEDFRRGLPVQANLSGRPERVDQTFTSVEADWEGLAACAIHLSEFSKGRLNSPPSLNPFPHAWRGQPVASRPQWLLLTPGRAVNKKEAAYAKLVSKLREIEPDAARDTVIKRINNLRSAVRKEKKKVDPSKKSGTSPDAIYKPIWWYDDLFTFLEDQETPASLTSNLDDAGNDTLITVSCF